MDTEWDLALPKVWPLVISGSAGNSFANFFAGFIAGFLAGFFATIVKGCLVAVAELLSLTVGEAVLEVLGSTEDVALGLAVGSTSELPDEDVGVGVVPESAKELVEATMPPKPSAAVRAKDATTLVVALVPARCAPARRACLAVVRLG
jgi:hypothetical protein